MQLVLHSKSQSMTVFVFASFLLLMLLRSSSSSSLTGATELDEASSLLQFKQSCIQNDPKGYLTNWNTATYVCSWVGVYCSSYDNHIHSLNLSNMELTGQLSLYYVMALPKIVEVNLHGNFFYGSPFSTLFSFSCNLKKLDVSLNHLSGSLQRSFFNVCQGLVSLNLSRNSFGGYLSRNSSGGDLSFGSSLQELDLSTNQIYDIDILKHTLLDCPELNHLNLSDNILYGRFPDIVSSVSSNLTVLDLSLNIIYGEIPKKFMSSAANTLRHLDLSRNNITGNFSSYDFGDCKRISTLDISSNGFNGNIPMSLVNCKLLETLALSSNSFSGQLPAFWSSFENLKHIHLADNNFQGKIPNELGYTCDTIVEIDLSMNRFSGEMPKTFIDCQFLERLNLRENQLSGNFLEGVVSTISSLKYLHLSFNNLSGILPLQSLTNCTSLEVIDLSSNYYSGNIPTGFDFCKSLPSLRELLFAGNFISGKIPSEFGECVNLEKIDFSLNLLNGLIPSTVWSLPKVTDFIMWDNKLEGEIPANICTYTAVLKNLILGYNDLSGTIPTSITNCRNMMRISLKGNRLTGKIPENIGVMTELEKLDLSHNHLCGSIPSELGRLSFLSFFDVSYNNLTGPIPMGGQLSTFSSSTYENNSGLCGFPLPPCLAIPENVNNVSDSRFGSERMFIDDGSLLSGFLFGLISSASIFSIVTNLRRKCIFFFSKVCFLTTKENPCYAQRIRRLSGL